MLVFNKENFRKGEILLIFCLFFVVLDLIMPIFLIFCKFITLMYK